MLKTTELLLLLCYSYFYDCRSNINRYKRDKNMKDIEKIRTRANEKNAIKAIKQNRSLFVLFVPLTAYPFTVTKNI